MRIQLPLKAVEDIAGTSLFNITGLVTNLVVPDLGHRNKKGTKQQRVLPQEREVVLTIKDGTSSLICLTTYEWDSDLKKFTSENGWAQSGTEEIEILIFPQLFGEVHHLKEGDFVHLSAVACCAFDRTK